MDRYGEDKKYPNRIYLLYDGIHYDALAFSPLKETLEVEDLDLTVFSVNDFNMETKCVDIVKQLNKAKILKLKTHRNMLLQTFLTSN
jgi:ubiquitin thioesterase OTU1